MYLQDKQDNQRWQIPRPATCHMPVLGNVHPINIEKICIFRDVFALLARVFIFLIDRVTHEVAMKNI